MHVHICQVAACVCNSRHVNLGERSEISDLPTHVIARRSMPILVDNLGARSADACDCKLLCSVTSLVQTIAADWLLVSLARGY